jgi:hypothetical protein
MEEGAASRVAPLILLWPTNTRKPLLDLVLCPIRQGEGVPGEV